LEKLICDEGSERNNHKKYWRDVY